MWLHGQAAPEPVGHREQIELQNEPVVSRGRLKVHAIGIHLFGQFVRHLLPTQRKPAPSSIASLEEQPSEDQRNRVRREVITVDIGQFDVAFGEVGM